MRFRRARQPQIPLPAPTTAAVYVALKARLRNGEMIFAKTAKYLVDEYLKEQEKRRAL
jgi:hypothetical protein